MQASTYKDLDICDKCMFHYANSQSDEAVLLKVEEAAVRVEELEAKVEEAAMERKDIMATLLKVLDYFKIIESPSTY